jgi:hypothetical protein
VPGGRVVGETVLTIISLYKEDLLKKLFSRTIGPEKFKF